jgi:large subunit ribosomal protein L29
MKAAELRDRSVEELREAYEEKRQELFMLNVRKDVADKADNPLKVRALRRTIARIKTVMREQEREGEKRHG